MILNCTSLYKMAGLIKGLKYALKQYMNGPLVPAGDHEWSFVVNFETVAIRFSCNSRATMEEWVDCIRNKLGEMGILNPKGNLYSKVPTNPSPTKTRNPMSPLPQPPPVPGTGKFFFQKQHFQKH